MRTKQELSLNLQDKAVPIADSQEKPDEHLVQIKNRRGHKGHEGHRRKEKGKHNHKRGFRKRNHGNRKRHHSDVNKKLKRVPNQKDLQKFVTKRMKHLRRKQQKKDNTP